MKRIIFALLLSLVAACDDTTDRIKRLISPSKPVAVTADVICDFGGGSGSAGCTEASLESLLREITPTLAAGSVIRLHGMTDDVAQATQLATFTTTAPKKKTVRAVAGHQQRQTDAIVTQFIAAAQPLFQHEDRRQSPIFETIARVLIMESSPNTSRAIYVSTDARHVSRGSPALGSIDYECATILTADELAPRLRNLFPQDSANGVVIHFRHVKLEPVAKNRCPSTIERYSSMKESFRAFEQVGARVTWSMN